MPRPWSARIRCAFVACSDSPYATPLSLGDPVHDRLVAVGLVDGDDALEDRRGPLEAHAGVDVLLRERRQRAVLVELVLHEHEVPELEEAVALAAGRAVGAAAAELLAAVVEELGVGPAGARARRPTRSSPSGRAGRCAPAARPFAPRARPPPRPRRARARGRRRTRSPRTCRGRPSCGRRRTPTRGRSRLP